MHDPANAPTTPMSVDGLPPPSTIDEDILEAWHPRAGDLVADHRLERILGRGGMGMVWFARHVTLDRPAAVKVLLDPLADATARERFLREARACAKVRHPHVVDIFHAGTERGQPFLILEFVAGGSLHDRIRACPGGLPFAEALRLIRESAEGLAAIHAAGILHRDIKPANILIDAGGHALLSDFGLAKSAGESRDLSGGRIVGTPRFLCPEIIAGEPADARADIYALGATLYEALGNQPLVTGDTPFVLFKRIRNGDIRPLAELRPNVPPAIAALVHRMLARDPTRRPADAATVSTLLRDLEVGLAEDVAQPVPTARRLVTFGAVAAALLAIGIGILAIRHRSVEVPSATPTAPTAIGDHPHASVAPTISPRPDPAESLSHPLPHPRPPPVLHPVIEAVALLHPPVFTVPPMSPTVVASTSNAAEAIPDLPQHAAPETVPAKPIVATPQRRGQGDPFAGDAFATGWRQITTDDCQGVFSADQKVVAWGAAGVLVSNDQGSTWSNPVPLRDNGPLPVGEVVIAGNQIWVRGGDGSLRVLGEQQARNRTLGLGAVTRILPAGNGLLAVEEAATNSALVQGGTVLTRASGQVIAALDGGVVVAGGRQLLWLTASGAREIGEITGPAPHAAAASGPAGSIGFAADGSRFDVRGGHAKLTGNIAAEVLCWSAGETPDGGIALGLMSDPSNGLLVTSVRGGDNQGVNGTAATTDLPPGTRMVAACGPDLQSRLRLRLVAAGSGGIWVYRFR